MRVYQAEKDAGVDCQMNEAGNASFVTAQVQLRDVDKYFEGMSVADLLKTASTVQSVEELLGKEQFDLALIVSVLVSTGWNLNDDIFVPEEVWKARSSPVHKPINDKHDATKILGHIVQSKAVDKTGNEIKLGDTETPPDDFDLEVAGVLYRQFAELRDRINEIIEKAQAGEVFVSMEAWFPDFGYGLAEPTTGKTKLIKRTEETAFLTKHLRIYGGSGEYQGYKIGRVLRNVVFGAQGLVDKPANPESVIRVAANKVAASDTFVMAKLSELLEGGVEDVDEKQLKAKLEEVQAVLEGKEVEVAELQKAAKDYDGQIVGLTEKVDELTASIAEASEKAGAIEAEKVEVQAKLDKATKKAEKSEAELDEIRKNETARERFVKLSEVKAVEDEKTTLAELRDMTDDTFVAVLKYAGETKSEDNVDKGSEDKTDVEQVEAALANVKEDDGADFNASSDVQKSEAKEWVGAAYKLCGREDKTDEGGE